MTRRVSGQLGKIGIYGSTNVSLMSRTAMRFGVSRRAAWNSVGSSSVRRSAGILMFRYSGRKPMVLLVHPGGPFWRNKDRNSWSIPKGEFGDDETAEAAAVREFEEETGLRPAGTLLPLGEAIQAGGKRVTAFAMAGDLDASRIESVSCEIEWPPKSGRLVRVAEVDRAEWFTLDDARDKITKGQSVFLDRLEQILRPMPSI